MTHEPPGGGDMVSLDELADHADQTANADTSGEWVFSPES
jgi:hypothetical protein